MKDQIRKRLTGIGLVGFLPLLISSVAAAAPTVDTYSGNTQVTLAAGFVGPLESLGVEASGIFPSRISRNGTVRFSIPTGEIDLETARGQIIHEGGLNLSAGDLTVALSSFIIDTQGSAPVLTGLVKVNDSLVGRLPLFNLQLNSAPDVRTGRVIGRLTIRDVGVTLTADAAGALNDVFEVTAFVAGFEIGTARVRALTFEPDRIRF